MQDNSLISHLFTEEYKEVKSINGIPWAYKNPEEKLIEWSYKTFSFFEHNSSILKSLQGKLNNNEFKGLTKQRIQKYLDDKNSYLKKSRKLLKDFLNNEQEVSSTSSQNILSYEDLIFRDWLWGKSEVEQYYEKIQNDLTGREKNILVLGAGACGLSYTIAKNTTANVIACDINPHLFLAAQKITNNKSFDSFEFTESPKELSLYSKKVSIDGQEKLNNHFQVFCDFNQIPFKLGSFDTVVSCWFYDIIPSSLEESILHTNSYLNDEGKILFLGPSNFNKNQISKQLTKEEIVEAFDLCFKSIKSDTFESDYLADTSKSQKRIETLLYICASLPKNRKLLIYKEETHIPLNPQLDSYKQKITIFEKILKHVTAGMSYEELSKKLEVEFGFSKEEAKYYTKNFMNKILSEL